MKNQIEATLLGLAIGDALGVPVEFVSREILEKDPVIGYRGFGTHTQAAGTFSDDSSLSFCLVESLIEGYSLDNLAQKMVSWRYEHYWTANGYAFDCGNNISEALDKLKNNHSPKYSGNYTEKSNSNGSLMRILPLVFYLKDHPVEFRYMMVKEISSLTHAHDRSILACFYLVELAREIMISNDIGSAFARHIDSFKNNYTTLGLGNQEFQHFDRLCDYDFAKVISSEILSTGYVIHTLEASVWCLLNSLDYSDAILKAVNLGGDTDTVGCITGGLAGLFYGLEGQVSLLQNQLRRSDDVVDLADRFHQKLSVVRFSELKS